MAEKSENPISQEDDTERFKKYKKQVVEVGEDGEEKVTTIETGDFIKGTIEPDKKG